LAIAGRPARSAPDSKWTWLRNLAASLTLKVAALVAIFIALPIALYSQFETADEQRRELIVRSIQQRNALTSETLKPVLQNARPKDFAELNGHLQRAGDGTTILNLLFRPGNGKGESGFLYVASAPPTTSNQGDAEIARLQDLGVLQRLEESCTNGSIHDIQQRSGANAAELLTSVMPIQSESGCWVLVAAQPMDEFLNASIGQPYWQSREVRVAAIFYLAAALVAILIATSVWQSLNRFRRGARQIRQGRDIGRRFSELNSVPELATVAADLDSLVEDLHKVAVGIRRTAEDNAHSLKGPVSAIELAMSPLRNALPANDEKATHALHVVQTSIDRLRAQISTALHIDFSKANLLDAPRSRVNLTAAVAETLLHYRDNATEKEIRMTRSLDDGVMVMAAEGVVDILLECVLDNALSFSPKGGVVSVTLKVQPSGLAVLRVDDEGPGVPPEMIEYIFERSVSLRSDEDAKAGDGGCHAGLGLWIARQNVESMGGTILATNRVGGGLSIQMQIPVAG